jgi:CDP-diacylglycerol---glycerol-3-phosphate 3-phosphatidyltransferase
MSTYGLKPRFQSLLRPLVRLLAELGVTANMVSVTAIIFSCIAALTYAIVPSSGIVVAFYVITLLPLRMALNAIDGMLAREFAMESKLGRFLDGAGNLVSDIALYLPLVIITSGPTTFAAAVFIVLVAAAELAAVSPCFHGGERRNEGPMGKSDRAFAVSGLVISMFMFGYDAKFFALVLFVFSVMLIVTISNRLEEGDVL